MGEVLMMEQSWFEMADIRRRRYANSVWVPLRTSQVLMKAGEFGSAGFQEEYFGAGCLAVPTEMIEEAKELGWMEIGVVHDHNVYVQDGRYLASDRYEKLSGQLIGIPLVLEQRLTNAETLVWHLHQDLVIALGLLREDDVWVCPGEGYIEVARLQRDKDGAPILLEIRFEFLVDYLCARGMTLRISSYRSRREIVEDANHISWVENPFCQETDEERWEGGVGAISEGGMPYGSQTAVLHIARTDVDSADDVPDLGFPTDEGSESHSYRINHEGKKLYLVQSEYWRNEWIDAGAASPRVRRDDAAACIQFITDVKGTLESKEMLVHGIRWLWFKPDVIATLAKMRGGHLGWYTRDTGDVRCSPDNGVHFGVNSVGLVNVFAKDIALLPDWQQRVWAGFNVSPDGGVSEELLDSQMRCRPASTHAPEEEFASAINDIDEVFFNATGKRLMLEHPQRDAILREVHRFRATDLAGVFALAKDAARLTADSIDVVVLQELVSPPRGEKWGSLKSLEKVLATLVSPEKARALLTPLVGAYELRLMDAHLPGSDTESPAALAGIDVSWPPIQQGFHLIRNSAEALRSIADALAAWRGAHAKPGDDNER